MNLLTVGAVLAAFSHVSSVHPVSETSTRRVGTRTPECRAAGYLSQPMLPCSTKVGDPDPGQLV